jgi:hypothetical protein
MAMFTGTAGTTGNDPLAMFAEGMSRLADDYADDRFVSVPLR